MDAIFIDSNGNRKNFLYQYDVGQTFVIEDFEYEKAPKVQFSIKSIKTSPSVSSSIDANGDLHVSIPDMLLTYGENIVAYLYIDNISSGSVVETVFISVMPRKRPADYIYTEEMFVRSINGAIMAKDRGIAEVVLWSDSNERNENRIGYFVSVAYDSYNKNLITTKATSVNDVYGVVVNKTGFVTNCDESKLDSDGDLLQQYAYVCTSGFAEVIDNNTCAVGNMCIPNSLGIATPSSNTVGYKVVSRIDDRHVLIFVDPSMQSMNDVHENIDNVKSSLNSHTGNMDNPHGVTKAQVGLGKVDNTSDLKKPVSEAQSKAIAEAKKAGTDAQSTVDDHKKDTNNPHGVTKSQVGLDKVDNTSDAEKPISDATQKALDEINEAIKDLAPQAHADTHATGGEDAISPASIGAVAQTDFDALKNKVDSLEFSNGIVITDSVTNKQYTLGMQDGKLVVILIDEGTTTQ